MTVAYVRICNYELLLLHWAFLLCFYIYIYDFTINYSISPDILKYLNVSCFIFDIGRWSSELSPPIKACCGGHVKKKAVLPVRPFTICPVFIWNTGMACCFCFVEVWPVCLHNSFLPMNVVSVFKRCWNRLSTVKDNKISDRGDPEL